MKLINITLSQVERELEGGGWRVVTRSPYSGKTLKVWCKKKQLAEAQLLSKGVNRGIRENQEKF